MPHSLGYLPDYMVSRHITSLIVSLISTSGSPQPTREDLDVSRALGDTLITPDLYPNLFHWKLALNKFLRDTNYR